MSGTRSIAARAQAGPADGGRQRSLSLALLVIATAQLMVVLDSTIVNVALPPIQRALGFSGSGLEWVVNAYALAFGGLLLLGGRAGDILGRRRVFIVGVAVFSLASLLGGLATTQEWLLVARALQGIGAAIVAPTALSLVTTTFPEGAPRNRAMGVYAAMSLASRLRPHRTAQTPYRGPRCPRLSDDLEPVVRPEIVEAAGFVITAARRSHPEHVDRARHPKPSTLSNIPTSLNVITQ